MILFLDFDGVLHPERPAAPGEHLFCRLPLLENWLRGRPGVDLVISSSWREAHPLDELVGYFTDDLQGRVLGATPAITSDEWAQYDGEPPPLRFRREMEIRRWRHQSAKPWRPWAALDDQPWLFAPFCEFFLVTCDGSTGLTPRNLEDVDAILARQHAR